MIDTAMEMNNIARDPFHADMLSELFDALGQGVGVLNEILSVALAGSNHLPGPDDLHRALVAGDVHDICSQMLARQALTQEALRAQKEAAQKIREAQANMEEAQRIVDAAKAEEDRLKGQLNIGMRDTMANLATTPGGGPQRVVNGDGGAGNEPQPPHAGHPHVPALAPIIVTTPRVNPIPNPAPTVMSQVEKANVLREAERQKANDDFEALAEARAREEAPYVEANEFSFLREYPNLILNKIETNRELPTRGGHSDPLKTI